MTEPSMCRAARGSDPGPSRFGARGVLPVGAEMHVYVKGGHAFGLRRTESPITGWPALVEAWLRTIGILSPSPAAAGEANE